MYPHSTEDSAVLLIRRPGFEFQPTPMNFFQVFFWLLVIRNPPETVIPKGKGQRLGVVTERLGACLGFDSRDQSLDFSRYTFSKYFPHQKFVHLLSENYEKGDINFSRFYYCIRTLCNVPD